MFECKLQNNKLLFLESILPKQTVQKPQSPPPIPTTLTRPPLSRTKTEIEVTNLFTTTSTPPDREVVTSPISSPQGCFLTSLILITPPPSARGDGRVG
ncbi:hypothetical protein CDAR_26211 [Caerostris darwini]|uniref:Uncharacterized protein n=1 Tax=Caerostris darwini TaxID=1538125 RepID=A0AAV4NC31_9ARAC|nr:hypothetical protein CDAR_26211 [Caerostris darwini]